MIKIGDNIYRNLEELVQKNKEDIARHYEVDRALSNLGVRIVGQVETELQLPDPLTYSGEYGDTYAVGNKAQVDAGTGYYTYYVYTRPDQDSGYPDNHWLNVGRISIVGPLGPVGPEGPEGPRGEGARIYVGPTPGFIPNEGDIWIDTSGIVYQWVVTSNGLAHEWQTKMSIKGPRGIQGIQGVQGPQGPLGQLGPKGETGDVGGFINIAGQLSSSNQLPLPSTLNNLTIAYLVGDNNELYIQVGPSSEEAIWTNMGQLNVATYVTVNGQFLNIWEANTKVDTSVVENLTDLSIPFWLDGKLQPLEGLKTYRDGKQVYLGTDTDEKLALQQNQIYLQDLLPANDPRKVLVSSRTGVTFDNFAKRTVYGYDSIDTVPSINNEFGNYNETQRKRLMFPAKSGTIAVTEDVYTKTEIDSKNYGLPLLAGFTAEYSINFTYNNMLCTGTRYKKGLNKAIVFEIWRTSNQTVTPNPIEAVVMTLGRWNTPGIRIDQLLSVSGLGHLSNYKYIYPLEAHWVVKPEVNGFLFNDSGFVVPQVYDAINAAGQATVWGMGVRFTNSNANSNLIISGEYIKVMLTDFD